MSLMNLLVTLLIASGGQMIDLLDYIETDYYWIERGVEEVDMATMIGYVDADSDVGNETDRLMAIRSLGEMGGGGAVEVLVPLVESDDVFVSYYARRSISWIREEGEYPSRVNQSDLDLDLSLMPPDSMAIAQYKARPGFARPIDWDALLPEFPESNGLSKADYIFDTQRRIYRLISRIGNMHIEALTVGLSFQEGGESPSSVFIVLRGHFDRPALARSDWPYPHVHSHVDGSDVITVNPTAGWGESVAAMIVPNDQQLVIAMAPGRSGLQLPVDRIVGNISNPDGEIRFGESLLMQYNEIDKENAAAWMAIEIPSWPFPANEMFQGSSGARLTLSYSEGRMMDVTGVIQYQSNNDADQAASEFRRYLENGASELELMDDSYSSVLEPMIGVLRQDMHVSSMRNEVHFRVAMRTDVPPYLPLWILGPFSYLWL